MVIDRMPKTFKLKYEFKIEQQITYNLLILMGILLGY